MRKENGMPDFVLEEEKTLKFWEDNHIFEKMRAKNEGKTPYRFLDGPMTANNTMGVHHAFGRTLKDVYIKYKAMSGFQPKYQNGFDAHGLPVETAVEKQLGMKNKKDILAYGLDKFVDKCLERCETYGNLITNESKKLGQFMDWEHSYYTNSTENITSIWYYLKKCHENGWLETEHKPMQWCPRCGTSLSEHEMVGSYKDVTHTSVYFKAQLKDNRCILVWTTTPWTLSANVAVAVNPDNDYLVCKVKSDFRLLIIGKEAKKVLRDDLVEVVETLKGQQLVGEEYETPFNELEMQQFVHKIVPWEDVSATDGTGAVHIAPGCGTEDFELGRRLGLPEICPIDENGVLYKNFGVLAGYSTSEVRDVVFDELKKRNKLYKLEEIVHSYPICWRCKNEVVFRLIDGWFIRVDEIRPQLIKAIENVVFEPDYLKKRMLDWLNNMGDWNISRSRFYGVPLPIYPCSCGHTTVVGSLEELAKLSSKEEVDKLPHLHRPYIDSIQITCPHCGKKVSRIPEVGDCWLDAGITPFSTNEYFTNKDYWKTQFPSEVAIEMREQIRLWFYSLLFMSVVLEGRAPYEKIIGYEAVTQEDGSKFSKSGYMITFSDYQKRLGADTARYLFTGTALTTPVRFGYNLGEEARRKMLGYFNAYMFFNTYACIDNPDIAEFTPKDSELTIIDKWLVQLINDFVKTSKQNYDNNRAYDIVHDFEVVTDKITNFYIRTNRRRFWKGENGIDKKVAYWCLYNSLKAITLVMAPIIPFTCEYIWQHMVREVESNACESVFLHDFATPIYDKDYSKYLVYADIAQNVITLGQRLRNENQLKVKQPLSKAYIVTDDKDVIKSVELFNTLIKEELNIKNVDISNNIEDFNNYYLVVNFKEAGRVLKGDVQKLKLALENANDSKMQEYVKGYDKGSVEVLPFGRLDSALFVKHSRPRSEFIQAQEGSITVVLDITLDDELIAEGLKREITRCAQLLRKEADFRIDQRVLLEITSQDKTLCDVIQKYSSDIQSEVLASEFNKGHFTPDITREMEVGDSTVTISMKGI